MDRRFVWIPCAFALAATVAISGSQAASSSLADAPAATHPIYVPLAVRDALKTGTAPVAIGGRLGALVSDGQLAYVLQGQRLAVVAPADPGDGWLKGESAPLSVPVAQLTLAGGIVYAAVPIGGSNEDPRHGSPAGLATFDVRDPARPRLLGFWRSGDCSDVVLRGAIAWLACGGLLGVDVTNPAVPVQASWLLSDGDAGYAVEADGPYVYMVGWNVQQAVGVVRVVSVAEPAAPRLVGRVTFPSPDGVSYSGSDWLARRGRVLYAANYRTRTVTIVDVATPTAPRLIGTLDAGGEVGELAVVGDVLAALTYETDVHNAHTGRFWLRTWTLATPDRPLPAGSLEFGGMTGQLTAYGQDVLVSDGHALGRVSLADPHQPRLAPASPASRLDQARIVVRAGARLFVSDGTTVYGYDVFDPDRPVELGHYRAAGNGPPISALAATPDTLYVARGGQPVEVVSWSDPGAPVRLGEVPVAILARGLAVAGDVLYIADTAPFEENGQLVGEVRVFDVADPAAPRLLARIDSVATAVAAKPGQLLVAELCGGQACVSMYDTTQPAEPRRLSQYGPLADVAPSGSMRVPIIQEVALAGRYGFAGTVKLDFAEPERPQSLGRYDVRFCYLCGGAPQLAAGGDTVALSSIHYLGQRSLADATSGEDPHGYAPVRYRLPYTTTVHDLATDGPVIYAGTSDGLWIIRTIAPPDERPVVP